MQCISGTSQFVADLLHNNYKLSIKGELTNIFKFCYFFTLSILNAHL